MLFIIDHAPDYRESFLSLLGEVVELTVVAQACEKDGLVKPAARQGYSYIELPSYSFLGFRFQFGIKKVFDSQNWDLVCCSLNLRHPLRYLFFYHRKETPWVWWGQVFGRNEFAFLDTIKKKLITVSDGCLVYTSLIAEKVSALADIPVESFNNSEVLQSEFRSGVFSQEAGKLKILYVGRYQERKKLHRLISLAERNEFIEVRLVGKGMNQLSLPADKAVRQRVTVYGHTVGNQLNEHFDWCDLVVNPGHIGLLVMNAARHGKGIVIDSSSKHAPEYILAEISSQPFVDFSNDKTVDNFFRMMLYGDSECMALGHALQERARKDFTVESMVRRHFDMFERILIGK